MLSSHYKNIEFITQEILDGNLPPEYMNNPHFMEELQALINTVSDQAREALAKNEWLENEESRTVMRILTSLHDLNEKQQNGMLSTIGFTSEQIHILNREFSKIFNNDVDLMLNSIKQQKSILDNSKIHNFVHQRNTINFKYVHQYNDFVKFVQNNGSPSMKAERAGLLALYLQYQFDKDCESLPTLQHFVTTINNNSTTPQDKEFFSALLNERLNAFAQQPGFIKNTVSMTTSLAQGSDDPQPVNHVFDYVLPEDEHNFAHRVSPARRFDAHALIDGHLHVMCMTSNHTLQSQNRQSSSIAMALANTQQMSGHALFDSYTVESVIIPKEFENTKKNLQDALMQHRISPEGFVALKSITLHQEILNIMANHGELHYEKIHANLLYRHAGSYAAIVQPKPFGEQVSHSFTQLQLAADTFQIMVETYGLHLNETELSHTLNSLTLAMQHLMAADYQHLHVSAEQKETLIDQLNTLSETYPKLNNEGVTLVSSPAKRMAAKNKQYAANQQALATMLEHTRHINNTHTRMVAMNQLAKEPDAFVKYQAEQSQTVLDYIYQQGFHHHFGRTDNQLSLSVNDLEELLVPMIHYVVVRNKQPLLTSKNRIPVSDMSLLQTLYHYMHHASDSDLDAFLQIPVGDKGQNIGHILTQHPYFIHRLHDLKGEVPPTIQEQYHIHHVDDDMNVHMRDIDILVSIQRRLNAALLPTSPSI